MYKTRLVLIIILLTNFNIFSQAEEQITVNDTINNLPQQMMWLIYLVYP